jgi:glycosyltransferase involved in cell wall biosynthesis
MTISAVTRDPTLDVAGDTEVLFLAPGDVGKGRVEPISWMQTCCAYAERGLNVALVTLRVRRPDAVDPSALWEHYGIDPTFRIVVLPTRLGVSPRVWWFQLSAGASALGLAALKLFAPRARRHRLVVHARSPVMLLPFVLLRRLLVPDRRPRLVLELHSMTGRRTARILRSADLVVVNSRKLADDVASRFGVDRDRILYSPLGPYNCIRQHDKGEARGALDLPDGAVIAAYVGKLTDEICDFLLKTGARLAGMLDSFRLLIVGGNPTIGEYARRRVQEMGLEETVLLAGFVEPSRVELYQAAADVLLFHVPETFGTFEYCTPSKGYEYQAAGRPIVATDIPLFEEVFGKDGERAIRVREHTPRAFADGVLQALALPDDGKEMTERATRWVSERTWESRVTAISEALGL